MMVSDFLENGNSGGIESKYSSDSDSGLPDLSLLADKVSGMCNASCIGFALVKLLRLSGFNAGVCTSRWQGSGNVPGGDHEYIDIVHYKGGGTTERLIVVVNFRSHFEIARAVESYNRILSSLPIIFVGSSMKLEQFLEVIAEAARSSLKQNSMPLPPWRSFDYLQAKWHSPYNRKIDSDYENCNATTHVEHKNCAGHLKSLHTSLLSEIEVERMLKPFNRDTRLNPERRRHATFS